MKHTGKVQGGLAFILTAGFFAVIWIVVTMQSHSSMRDALLIMVGALGAAFGSVVNYYFGSSSGSARKDEFLVQQADDSPSRNEPPL
jgi:membrane protein YqaA with SNARE-associated domain